MKLMHTVKQALLRAIATPVLLAGLLLVLTACPSPGSPPTPSFTTSLSPSSLSITQGQSGHTSLTLTPQHGFTGAVNLSLVNAPAGVSLSPAGLTVSGPDPVSQTLTISTTSAIPAGTHPIQVRAVVGGITHDAALTLTVRAQQIAFVSYRDGNSEIYVMNADGKQANLTDHAARDANPAWSPDGRRLAFVSRRDGNNETDEIYVKNADGSGLTRLTNNTADDMSPAWSPDGRRLAFVSNRDGKYDIYLMNADGSGQTNLTNHPDGDRGPVWSPDGNAIAFVSDRDGNEEIYVMNANGSGPTQLTDNTADDWSPAWRP
jgi:WD40 repeat protein